MPPAEIPDLLPAAAELFLAFAGMALLMLGVFQKSEDDSPVGTSRLVAHLGVTSLALALLLVLAFGRGPAIAFGGLFVVEIVSVIVQVASFRMTGRRVFRMAPLHHHFELKGWPEPRVIVRFWIITLILVIVGLSTLKLR